MNYADSLKYLNSFLNLERIVFSPDNRLWNLARMKFLLSWTGHPETDFFPVLIAGTKGKGSTGFFLESILREAGIPVGFYSSPHLEDPRERIRLNGRMISREKWAAGIRKIRSVLQRKKLPPRYGNFTYFEIMTLLAILVFKKAKIRIGIFEVGMGGRLDATNALKAKVIGITSIGFDHEAFLGNTLARIAYEKAAVIHRGAAAVTVSNQPPAAMAQIRLRVKSRGAQLWLASPSKETCPGLEGEYQKWNASAASKMAEILRARHGFRIPAPAVRAGINRKDWPGRFELIHHGSRTYVLDCAHNPDSVRALVRHLQKKFPRRKRVLIFGVSRDKRSEVMLQILSKYFPDMVITPLASPRTQEVGILAAEGRGLFRRIVPAGHARQALSDAKKMTDDSAVIVVTGSFYLAGEVRKLLKHSLRS